MSFTVFFDTSTKLQTPVMKGRRKVNAETVFQILWNFSGCELKSHSYLLSSLNQTQSNIINRPSFPLFHQSSLVLVMFSHTFFFYLFIKFSIYIVFVTSCNVFFFVVVEKGFHRFDIMRLLWHTEQIWCYHQSWIIYQKEWQNLSHISGL